MAREDAIRLAGLHVQGAPGLLQLEALDLRRLLLGMSLEKTLDRGERWRLGSHLSLDFSRLTIREFDNADYLTPLPVSGVDYEIDDVWHVVFPVAGGHRGVFGISDAGRHGRPGSGRHDGH